MLRLQLMLHPEGATQSLLWTTKYSLFGRVISADHEVQTHVSITPCSDVFGGFMYERGKDDNAQCIW